ncbi:homocysteine-responsive endoplasmic reticulum-resident ubiquitin-like domain member 1 protein isoform X1 [Carcharodon carcharias]|uniref:homocysteine-responsive endoplasmic reticulum-resident ubiquitin-like domain member 1 protein isoform X1 n=1 Tax=Carcharodon carcharias TaxID=13397 RepID=UPI001B7E375F|nr:homocysteine-responsive endoplasmic reticulum-resident ubiquitin-like domain member 1 protein isoform X1 [Carcharodon carcharias]
MGTAEETVTLLIKAPNQRYEDQKVQAELGWTVKRLKTELSDKYPSHPAESEQRLIYSGKLLPDHLLLRDVLRKSDQYHTLHLVCNLRSGSESTQAANVKQEEATPRASGQETLTVPTTAAADGLRHRGPASFPWAYGIWPAGEVPQRPVGMSGLAAYNLYSSQQIVWLQQMYARQYYMQYQAAVAAAAAAATNSQQHPVVAPGTPPALPNQPPLVNLAADRNVPLPQLNNPPANQNLRMNAQGGPVMDDDDELNRDWLDWLYLAARACFFLSIVYFYSSLSRVVLVVSAILLIYLHRAGWFPFRHPAPIQPIPNADTPAEAADPNHVNQELQENQDHQDIVQEESGTPDQDLEGVSNSGSNEITEAPLAPEAVVDRTTFANKAWVFFKTFFASLIPEGPQIVAN